MMAKILTLPNGHGERKKDDETHIALQFSLLILRLKRYMSLCLVYICLYVKGCLPFHKSAFHKLCFSFKGVISTNVLSGVQCRKAYGKQRPTS